MVFESWNFKHVLSEPEVGEISWGTINKTTVLPQPREEYSPFWLNSGLVSESDKDL